MSQEDWAILAIYVWLLAIALFFAKPGNEK